mgnify:CR=1 FL=1
MKRNQKGFTLMEMLIVVAIIAVLVAIAIPTFTAQLHKARVAADWANVRAYYAQIQADYMLTGEKNPKVKVINEGVIPDQYNISFLDGATVKLQAGAYWVVFNKEDGDKRSGYTVAYNCSVAGHNHHELVLGDPGEQKP